MSRQTRRHPIHPLLPVLYPSHTRILDKKRSKPVTTSKFKGNSLKTRRRKQLEV